MRCKIVQLCLSLWQRTCGIAIQGSSWCLSRSQRGAEPQDSPAILPQNLAAPLLAAELRGYRHPHGSCLHRCYRAGALTRTVQMLLEAAAAAMGPRQSDSLRSQVCRLLMYSEIATVYFPCSEPAATAPM